MHAHRIARWLACSATATTIFAAAASAIPPLSSHIVDARDLVPTAIVITETAQPDGRVLFAVSAGLRNADVGTWAEVLIGFSPDPAIATEVTDGAITVGAVAPSATVPAPPADTLQILVPAASVSTIRTRILSGELLTASGYEAWVLSGPAKAVDQVTEDAFTGATSILPLPGSSNDLRLNFAATNPFLQALAPGDVLIEDPKVNSMGVPPVSSANPGLFVVSHLPFVVSAITVNGNGTVAVDGDKREIIEVVRHATFQVDASHLYGSALDPTNPSVENNYNDDEADDREVQAAIIAAEDPTDGALADLRGFVALPIHFNDIRISDYLRLRGEFLVRASALRFEVAIRNFAMKRIAFAPGLTAELNATLEVLGGSNNTGDPLLSQEATIATIPLPPIPIGILGASFTINPIIVASVGVSANAPTGLTVPLQTSIVAGMEMGWDNTTGFFYEPVRQFNRPAVSDPTVFDALQANAGAWAELELQLLINGFAGPTMAVRNRVDFTLQPLVNPWWKLEGAIDLIGRFTFSVFGFGPGQADIVDHIFVELPWLIRDAGGPLIPATPAALSASVEALAAGDPTISADTAPVPFAGSTVRWASTFTNGGTSGGYQDGFIIVLDQDGETETIVGGESPLSNFLAKYSASGDMLWSKVPPIGVGMSDGAADVDGNFVVAGQFSNDLWIGKFSPDGERLWAASFWGDASFDPNNAVLAIPTVKRVVSGVDGTGAPVYYVLGSVAWGVVTNADPWVFKFDRNGVLLWARTYERPGDDTTLGLAIAANGDILISGETSADVAAPAGTPDSGNVLINASGNGLLMRINPAGDLLWARCYASRWGLRLFDIVEAPDGRIFFTGGIQWPVNVPLPSIVVGYCNSDGTGITHCLIKELREDPWPAELPINGYSVYDVGERIVWTPNGPLVVGHTGLGTQTAALCIGLTDELGVRFFTAFDGTSTDNFVDAAVASDGVVAMGTTQSFFTGPIGPQWSTVVAKLPWEGFLSFDDSTGAESYVIHPRIYKSSGTPYFYTAATTGGFGSTNDTSDVVITPTTLSLVTHTLPGVLVAGTLTPIRVERVDAAPIQITGQPANAVLASGAALDLTVTAAGGAPLEYQWFKNDVAIAGATGSTYAIPAAAAGDAAAYRVRITNAHGYVDSTIATVTVASSAARLVNLSARAQVGTGDGVLIPGFVVSGNPLQLLVRGVGPGLIPYGVAGALADPQLSLVDSTGATIATNDDWGLATNVADITVIGPQVGAFALGAGSKDAAVLVTLQPGLYTAVMSGVGNTTGVGLVELYEVNGSPSTGRLANMSVRAQVGTGDGILIPGIVVGGTTARTLLIRAVGPTLGTFNVTGVLANPQLTLFNGPQAIQAMDDWEAPVASVATTVGAFPLPAGSKDAAMVVTLVPGAYTAQVSGVGGTSGVCLVEVYEVP